MHFVCCAPFAVHTLQFHAGSPSPFVVQASACPFPVLRPPSLLSVPTLTPCFQQGVARLATPSNRLQRFSPVPPLRPAVSLSTLKSPNLKSVDRPPNSVLHALTSVEVGTPVTRCPPHRSRRALFAAPGSSCWHALFAHRKVGPLGSDVLSERVACMNFASTSAPSPVSGLAPCHWIL